MWPHWVSPTQTSPVSLSYLACRESTGLWECLKSSTFDTCFIMLVSRPRISFTTCCRKKNKWKRFVYNVYFTQKSLSVGPKLNQMRNFIHRNFQSCSKTVKRNYTRQLPSRTWNTPTWHGIHVSRKTRNPYRNFIAGQPNSFAMTSKLCAL